MSRIAIVGDVHIGTSVSTRTDDYFKTCLDKLRQIFENNDYVIFGGDLFHTPVLALDKFYELILLFREYKNVEKYCIIGNHDIFNLNSTTLPKTSLGLLELLGLVNILKPKEVVEFGEGLAFEATNVDFSKIENSNHKCFFLFHHFYNLNCSDSLSEDMLNNLFPNRLGCFCFHDHQTYEPINNVYRPGSLLRNAATDYNKARKPIYYQITTEEYKKGLPFREIQIDSIDGKDVFIDNVVIKKRERYLENLEKTIQLCSEKVDTSTKYSMIEVLKEIKAPERAVDYIAQICKVVGVQLK